MKYRLLSILISICLASALHAQQKRKLKPEDIYRIKNINDARISPDGNWIAYSVSTPDSAKDKSNSDIWMVSWDGTQQIQLTHSPDGESAPRWSPDGKYLSFTSSRQGAKGSQVWVMDRRGGEASKWTNIKGGLEDYHWSPDGKKILLVVQDPPDTSKTKTPKPIAIDRYHFKADVQGYLLKQHTHLYLLDAASRKLDTLTTGSYDENSPAWSPDSKQIAFVSNRTAEPDRNENADIWVMEATKGAKLRQLTTWKGSDDHPTWSPDGKTIAYLRSFTEENFLMYDNEILAVIPSGGGEPRLLTLALDRPVSRPAWMPDGQAVAVIVSDDREAYIGQVEAASGKVTRIAGGQRNYGTFQINPQGRITAIMSEPQLPNEVYAVEGGNARRLTHHQDALLANVELSAVSGFTSKSKDGTMVSNILYRAAGTAAGQKQPTIFYIHGGPVSQDTYGFDMTRQMLAAAGYNVVGVNYRGSNGRGQAFAKAIYADWGNKEVVDIHGAVDELVKQGVADPDRLGIGGWSYGGLLTDYSIATDTRFKAGISGAGSAMQMAMYGHDQYVLQYETELGVPWKNQDKWLKVSYPFTRADKIKTPTLFVVGEKDFNVPAIGSEQMYQALRSQNIPTGLVIYPGQFHGVTVPSYLVDRFHRYIDWYDKYLKGMVPVKVEKAR